MISALLAAAIAIGASAVPDRTIQLNGHGLRLHFANRGAAAAGPLLVYATGDGGWHRKDLAAYKQLVALGLPIVGFDSHDYVTHLGGESSTTPQALAADYQRIIAAARDALQVADDRGVILVGISRGAGLAVVAAGDDGLRASLGGVLAIALTREEEYVKWYRRLRRRNPIAQELEMVALYEYLPRLEQTPVAVIQSTRDHYLPAAEARQLFGPDTPYRWLQPVEARNHSFGGARQQLYAAMKRALDWLLTLGVADRQR